MTYCLTIHIRSVTLADAQCCLGMHELILHLSNVDASLHRCPNTAYPMEGGKCGYVRHDTAHPSIAKRVCSCDDQRVCRWSGVKTEMKAYQIQGVLPKVLERRYNAINV